MASRNLAVIFAFMIFYMFTYLFSTEYISAAKSKGEILLFRRGCAPISKQSSSDIEKQPNPGETMEQALDRQVSATIQRQTAIFQWKDICYDIKIKKESRRILDHVDGWVKPGTLTALMVSKELCLRMELC
jgi:ATP-binding cassette, subfamily G (WHITE), member 2, PDR